jgi:hypothetical protein
MGPIERAAPATTPVVFIKPTQHKPPFSHLELPHIWGLITIYMHVYSD